MIMMLVHAMQALRSGPPATTRTALLLYSDHEFERGRDCALGRRRDGPPVNEGEMRKKKKKGPVLVASNYLVAFSEGGVLRRD